MFRIGFGLLPGRSVKQHGPFSSVPTVSACLLYRAVPALFTLLCRVVPNRLLNRVVPFFNRIVPISAHLQSSFVGKKETPKSIKYFINTKYYVTILYSTK